MTMRTTAHTGPGRERLVEVPGADLARTTATARTLAEASISPNTAAAYRSALTRVDGWHGDLAITDASLAAYLGELYDSGRSPATASVAIAAVAFRARLAGQPNPIGEQTRRVLAGYRRSGADRGRRQAHGMTADDLAAILATAGIPRRSQRGVESAAVAKRRGELDAVIAGLLFMAGLRRSEVVALRWRDITDATDGGILVAVRRSKTDQTGERTDVRYLKNGAAVAVRRLRASRSPDEDDRVVPMTAQQVARRIEAAGRAAGVEARLTGHSGRVGLASELTARGASTADVMLAGGWKTARMVSHYAAGATAENGAVKRYL